MCFFFLQIAGVMKVTQIKGKECLAISYNDIHALLEDSWPAQKVYGALKEVDGAVKGRLRFLSSDSPLDYFKSVKGKDTVGRSVLRQSMCIPASKVTDLCLLIKGKLQSKFYTVVNK